MFFLFSENNVYNIYLRRQLIVFCSDLVEHQTFAFLDSYKNKCLNFLIWLR